MKKLEPCQDSKYRKVTHKFNDKHSATYYNIETGEKVIQKRCHKEKNSNRKNKNKVTKLLKRTVQW